MSLSCHDGYYLDGNVCIKCKTPCATCLNETFCYTCGFDPTNLRIRAPTCECDEEYSDFGDRCDTCTAPCSKCTGAGLDECTACNPYYYLDGTTCKECHVSCYECSGPDASECIFMNRIIRCRDGYYYDEDNSLCA